MSTRTFRMDGPRFRRLLQYVLVGAIGVAINQGTLYLGTAIAGAPYLVGGGLGRVLSVLFNYVVNDRWTWGAHGETGTRQWILRGGKYVATRVIGMGIGLTTLVLLVEVGGLHYLVANLLAIGIGVAWGFLASELWVWGDGDGTDTVRSFRDWVGTTVRGVDRHTWLVLLVSTALFVVLSVYTVSLYRAFWSTGADLGAYAHSFATTLDGAGWLQQGKYRINHPGGSYWGAHFSLTILGFLVPFALHQSPVTLLVVKSFVIAAGVPVFWLVAREHVDSRKIALLLTASYAINPFLWTAAVYDFQEQILLPIFVFGAYYAYRRERRVAFLSLFALALLTNEFVVFVAGGFLAGLAVATARKRRELAREGRLRAETATLAAAGVLLVSAKVLSNVVMSRFSKFGGLPTDRVADPIADAVTGGGVDPIRIPIGEVLGAVLRNPALAVDSLMVDLPTKLLFFALLMLPVMYLPLADEPTLGALLPYLGLAWILADNAAYYHFGAHYSLYLLPFVYIGAARTFGYVSRRFSSERMVRATSYAITLCIVGILLGGVVVTGMGYQMVPERNEHTRTLEAGIDEIPAEASLVTQNTIYPHVSTRSNAKFLMDAEYFDRYEKRYGEVTPEYLLIDTKLDTRPRDWSRPVLKAYSEEMGDEYGLYRYQDGIFVFRHGYEGPTKGITREEYSVETRRYRPTRTVVAGVSFGRDVTTEEGKAGGVTWKGPWSLEATTLPPGAYTATFRVNVSDKASGAEADAGGPVLSGQSSSSSLAPMVGVSSGTEGLVAAESIDMTGNWTNVTITFRLDRSGNVDFHGYETPDRGIRIKWVEIEEVFVQ